MKGFIRFYGWGVNMKFHMAIYTLALVFCKALANLLEGVYVVSSLTMLEMVLVAFAVAVVESFLFPHDREPEQGTLVRRTVWWALLCNLGFLGGALVFGWFGGVPVWAGIVLLVFLEFGIAAMWFGLNVALKKDTEQLNQMLHQYQRRD